MQACDLVSAESEHDEDAGHSIDWASIESASSLTCESLEKICAGRAPSTGKESGPTSHAQVSLLAS